jgi:acetoin utilization deacetylase AcuC-like enzyme
MLNTRVPIDYFDAHPSVTLRPSSDSYGRRMPRVSYIHEPHVGYFHYGPGHPMKPYRLALTHDLVMHYGLNERMAMHRGFVAPFEQLAKYHSDAYLGFLRKTTSVMRHGAMDKMSAGKKQETSHALRRLNELASQVEGGEDRVEERQLLRSFNVGEDCPLFEGLYDFCSLYTGSTLVAGQQIIQGSADIAINWSGGLHHAMKSHASGFCYVNDIVLVIVELLMHFARVLYVDIDVHHGDGVQEAFYDNDRVLCVSLHKYGDGFFPGTGALGELGSGMGLGFSLNAPLHNGIDDASYQYLFKPLLTDIMAAFDPGVVVLQCGADSLAGDRLGVFNLSVQGHGACVSLMKSFGVPLVVLGGGGYTIRNVSRCWTYETSILTNTLLSNTIPESSPHRAYFAPDHTLLSFSANHRPLDNENSRAYLDALLATLRTALRAACKGAPSVQLQYHPLQADGLLSALAAQSRRAPPLDDTETTHQNSSSPVPLCCSNDNRTDFPASGDSSYFKTFLYAKPDRLSLRRQIQAALHTGAPSSEPPLFFPLNLPNE